VNEHVDSRAFTYAVGASIALHAVLFALRAPESQPPRPASAPLVAHIAEPERPAAPSVAEPQPVPPPPKPKVEKPKPRPKIVQPQPQPAPAAPSPITVAPAPAPVPEITSEPAPAPPPSAVPPAPVATAPAAPPAPDPSTLIAQYRSRFIGAAVRYKRYPLPARDNGWEGDVIVHLEIGASGELAEVKVKRSSGHAVLDEQALQMFRLAAPEVPMPPGLRGRAFGFDVRAVYSLKD
jgi:protein TonB